MIYGLIVLFGPLIFTIVNFKKRPAITSVPYTAWAHALQINDIDNPIHSSQFCECTASLFWQVFTCLKRAQCIPTLHGGRNRERCILFCLTFAFSETLVNPRLKLSSLFQHIPIAEARHSLCNKCNLYPNTKNSLLPPFLLSGKGNFWAHKIIVKYDFNFKF